MSKGKNMFKKVCCWFLCLSCCLLLFDTRVSASESDEEFIPSSKYYTMNEYQGIIDKISSYESKFKEQYQIMSVDELNNYSELLKLKEDMHNYIYSLKELSVNELEDLNYTDSQITAIKNYDGSEEMTLAASATVSATLTLYMFYYDSSANRTYAGARFSGQWNGVPLQKATDETGIAIIGSNARFAHHSSTNIITHADGSEVRNTANKYYSMIGKVYRFGIVNANGNMFQQFYMLYSGVADGKVTVIDYAATYAHNYEGISGYGISIGVSGGSSVGGSLGISFTFDDKTEVMWESINTRTTYL